jgi:F-type H+-transporting ATPase subunit gamma
MSETPASLRRKIDGAGKIEGVIRTMKAMAASSIGQYETAVRALGDYQRCVELGLSSCLKASAAAPPARSAPRSARFIGAIVFGSDQGLVGRFNEVIADFAAQTLDGIPGNKLIWAVGERVSAQLQGSGMTLAGQFAVPGSVAAITPLVSQIQIASEARYPAGGDAEVYVFHNRPQSTALYEPVSQRLLPLDAQWRERLVKLAWPSANLPENLGVASVTLTALLREYLFISLYKACAESLASENGSRLVAMQRAEENIKRLSVRLGQTFYRLRQSAIDEELFDVMAGFNALSPDTQIPKVRVS